jgi:tRNA modification GTPase
VTAGAGETTVRCLTPPGSAAVAVLEVRGPEAWAVVRPAFLPRSAGGALPPDPVPGLLRTGRFGPPPADEVVLAVRSVDPELVIEVHCHGGIEVLRWLGEKLHQQGVTSMPSLPAAGARPANEAVQLLAAAPSLRTADILLTQSRGAMGRVVREVESELRAGRIDAARQRIQDVLRFAPVGRHLVGPWRVAVAGVPNVGKSSLVNALAGYRRSVVTPVAGTTRDVVATRLVIDGWPVELLDTAGLREVGQHLEATGVERSRSVLRAADLCVWVVEAASEPVWPPAGVDCPLLVVNKTDLPRRWQYHPPSDLMAVSAATGQGVDRLADAIARRLVPDPPPAGAAVPYSPRIIRILKAVQRHSSAGGVAAGLAELAALVEPWA